MERRGKGGKNPLGIICRHMTSLGRVAEVVRGQAGTYAILPRIKICRDLRTFWRSLGKKSAIFGQKQCFLGKKCTITWYILHILLS